MQLYVYLGVLTLNVGRDTNVGDTGFCKKISAINKLLSLRRNKYLILEINCQLITISKCGQFIIQFLDRFSVEKVFRTS